MEIKFSAQDPDALLENIQNSLTGNNFTKIVSIQRKNNEMKVQIKKMGTSLLVFKEDLSSDQILWTLTSEKIAMAHKPLKEKMMSQLHKIINKLDGEIVEA